MADAKVNSVFDVPPDAAEEARWHIASISPFILSRPLVRGRQEPTAAGPKYPSAMACCLAGILLLAASAGAPARANGGAVELSNGGLHFVQNPSVQMRSEQLFISASPIRVTYHFFNLSDQPVTNLVAFPMPAVTFYRPFLNIAIPSKDPVNFLDFTTTAGGNAVATRRRRHFLNV